MPVNPIDIDVMLKKVNAILVARIYTPKPNLLFISEGKGRKTVIFSKNWPILTPQTPLSTVCIGSGAWTYPVPGGTCWEATEESEGHKRVQNKKLVHNLGIKTPHSDQKRLRPRIYVFEIFGPRGRGFARNVGVSQMLNFAYSAYFSPVHVPRDPKDELEMENHPCRGRNMGASVPRKKSH